ncbi:MAG: ATP-binding protein [Ruminococcaceae bacterium]|nr:ATP-binding protein [Oscillospiraceae bacterium]
MLKKGVFNLLIRFSVENFLSFGEKIEFSMVASKMTRHHNHVINCKDKRILKGAYIFGANASGKTNLIKAIAFANSIVTQGLENISLDKKFFRIDPSYKNRPGVFQFDIYTNGEFYSYGFALSYVDSSIEEEWLYRIDNDREYCIFLRSKDTESENYRFASDLQFKSNAQRERFKVYSSDISTTKMKKKLFLSDVVMRSPDDEDDYKPFKDVMDWFNHLIVIFPHSKYSAITELVDNDDDRIQLETLLNYFDTGIETVSKKAIEFDKAFSFIPEQALDKIKAELAEKLKKDAKSAFVQPNSTLIEVKLENGVLTAYEVVSNHGNNDDLFEYSDESDGTQRLFDLIPIYQKALENCVVLIDELDRSLHTKAAQEFINYFYNLSNDVATQLIVTTHDSNLMDLDFIRQDEIWFVERQKNGNSTLYSLNKFKERFDKKVEKEYLLGRYGAIPIFREFVLTTSALNDGEDDGNND